jgi:hypothetical protein
MMTHKKTTMTLFCVGLLLLFDAALATVVHEITEKTPKEGSQIWTVVAGLKELRWWRNRPPQFPWPNPCLSCSPVFDLDQIREHLERAGLRERIRVELFCQDGKIFDLGVFGRGLSVGKSLRIKQIGQRQSELLQGGKGFKLVFRNMAGKMVHTQAINLKETAQDHR